MPVRNTLKKVKQFIKRHAAIFISAGLVVTAAGLGFAEYRLIDAEAGRTGVGLDGGSRQPSYSAGSATTYGQGAGIAITPVTYDITDILKDNSKTVQKNYKNSDGKTTVNKGNPNRFFPTCTEFAEYKDSNGTNLNGYEKGRIDQSWHTVTRTDKTTVYKMSNMPWYKILNNMNTSEMNKNTDATLVFVPNSTYAHSVGDPYQRDPRVTINGSMVKDNKTHVVWMSYKHFGDKNQTIGEWADKTKKAPYYGIFQKVINAERQKAKKHYKSMFNGENEKPDEAVSNRIDGEEKSSEEVPDDDTDDTGSEYDDTGDTGDIKDILSPLSSRHQLVGYMSHMTSHYYTTLNGKDDEPEDILNHEAFYEYLSDKDHFNELINAAKGKTIKDADGNDVKGTAGIPLKAMKLYAYAGNVTKSGNKRTAHVHDRLDDYLGHTLKNRLDCGTEKHDLKVLTEKVGYSEKSKKILDAVKKNDGKITAEIRNSYGTDDNVKYNMQKYITNTYSLAYLDMLLCGYSTAYQEAGKNSKAKVVTAWKDAIKDYIDSQTTDSQKMVVLSLNINEVSMQDGDLRVADYPTILHKKFNTEIGDYTNKTDRTYLSKGFLGITPGDSTIPVRDGSKIKVDAKTQGDFRVSKQMTSYNTLIGLDNWYMRTGRSISNADKNWSKKTNTWFSASGVINRMFDMNAIWNGMSGAYRKRHTKIYDSTASGKAGSEDYIEMLYGNIAYRKDRKELAKPEHGEHFVYGQNLMEPLNIYTVGEPPETSSGFELRLYSEAGESGNVDNPVKMSDTNGIDIHNTAEYAKKSVSQPGEVAINDKINLKIDTTDGDSLMKLIDSGAKFQVKYYVSKEKSGGDALKLVCLRKKSQKDEKADYKDISGGKGTLDDTSEKGLYPELKNPYKNDIKANSAYYGTGEWSDKDHPEVKDYKNLVWNDSLDEIKDLTVNVKKGEKTKVRLCVYAKILITKEDGRTPYFTSKDDPKFDDKGYTTTNPVYMTYEVSQKKTPPNYRFYSNTSDIDTHSQAIAHAYSEFKEGSVYNETFEAMAGVPSTRTMYFATGGEEFIVNLQAVYDDYVASKTGSAKNGDPDAYTAVRKYTVHFNDVDCEYKAGDTFKAISAGTPGISETFVADKNDRESKHTVKCEGNNAIPNSHAHVDVSEHAGNNFTAHWGGSIANRKTDGWNASGNVNPTGKPCEGGDAGKVVTSYSTSSGYSWDTRLFKNDIDDAAEWLDEMLATNKRDDGTVWRIDDSDGYRRVYKVGDANVSIRVWGTIGNTGSGGEECSYGTKSTENGNGAWITAQYRGDGSPDYGTGAGWTQGQIATATGDCKDTFDDKGNKTGHVHKSWSGYQASTHAFISSLSYSIDISFHNGTIKADKKGDDPATTEVTMDPKTGLAGIPLHALCGACCEHHLPAIEDKWLQKVRFDTIRFSAMKVWKLDDGYAVGMDEIKRKTDGDGTGIEDEGKYMEDIRNATVLWANQEKSMRVQI